MSRLQVNIVGLVEYAFQVGPKRAARKAAHDFVIFAAKDFERQVTHLLTDRVKNGPRPRPAPAPRKVREPAILEAEIVNDAPRHALKIGGTI